MAEEIRKGRFSAPSDVLDLEKLQKENQRILYLGMLVAIALHGLAASYSLFKAEEQEVYKPPTTELIIRRPRMTKAFEFKKRRVPKRVMQRRVRQRQKPRHEARTRQVDVLRIAGSVASFDFKMELGADMGAEVFRPEIIRIQTEATKEPERRISMKEELIDLGALDTGKYRGMVITDPSDRKNIKGFIYLANAWGTELVPSSKRAVYNLAQAINKHTKIEARVDAHLYLDDRKIFKVPFVYVSEDNQFELTKTEIASLNEYLHSGGFVVADNGTATYEYGPAEASLRDMFKKCLGNKAKFLPIANSHPLYHCFYDFDDGPPIGTEVGWVTTSNKTGYAQGGYESQPVENLEGIWLDERLVAIYSDKGYGPTWEKETGNEPQLKMGVNMVVFALIQEGSIAQKQIDLYSMR